MSSGIVRATAALTMKLDELSLDIQVIERLVRQERESRIDWRELASALAELKQEVEGWKEKLVCSQQFKKGSI